MKLIILIISLLLLNTLMTETLAASCPTTGQVTDATSTTLNNLLSGNTICVLPLPPHVSWGWEFQEYHQASGSLIDWKQGASSVTDPTVAIGTWSISGIGEATQVTYNYTNGGSSTYTYTVFDNGGGSSYSFCSAGIVVVTGTIKPGQGACP
jgi:hypothetical protein